MKKFRKARKCKQTGKSMYRTEEAAGRIMMRIWSHDTSADIYDLHVYQCHHCSAYHVGHRSYYEKELAKLGHKDVGMQSPVR